jgi:hypothetical protein
MRVVVALFVVVAIAIGGVAPNPAAGAEVEIEHCTLAITGLNKDGSYRTGDLECTKGPAPSRRGFSTLTTYIAVHYDGFNLTGSTLSIEGGSCSGGWLNLPASWQDRIESTSSGCTTRHYRDLNLGGPHNTTWSPGGNLSTLANAASSVSYS